MSRRFGRNQKRKMREELAMIKNRSFNYNKRADEAEYQLQNIIEQIDKVQPYSIFTPVREIQDINLPSRMLDLNIGNRVYAVYEQGKPPEPCIIDRIKVNRIQTVISGMADKKGILVHVKVCDKREVGYYISDKVIAQQGIPVQAIAKQLHEESKNIRQL